MSNVQLEMSGDEARLLASLKRSEAEIQRLEAALKKMGETGEKSSKKTQEQLWKEQREVRKLKGAWEETEKAREEAEKPFGEKLIPSITAAAGGIMSVTTALNALRAEVDQIIARQAKAADAAMTLNQARQDVIRNMPGASRAQIDKVIANITTTSRATNVDEKIIALSMASALSAGGGDIGAAESAVGQSARFLADRPEAIAGFAGSLLDLSKVTRTTDARVNQGLLSYVGGLSRVVKPELQAANIPESLIGQQAFGGDMRTSAALFAALTTGSGDITGARSGTAAIALAQQMQEFFSGPIADMSKGKGFWNRLSGYGKNIAFGAIPADTELQRLFALQNIPGLADAFLSTPGVSFEKKSIGPITQLLTDPTSDVARMFKDNMRKIPGQQRLAEIADEMLAARSADPLERAAAMKRAFESGELGLLTGNLMDVEGGISREGLKNLLVASGLNAAKTTTAMWGFEASSDVGREKSAASAIDVLQSRRRELLATFTSSGQGVGAAPAIGSRTPSDEDKRVAGLLQEVITQLKALNESNASMDEKTSGSPTLGKPDEDK